MKIGAKYGAMAGVIAWIVGGIMLGIHVGGYGAVILLAKLTGGSADSDLLSRLFVSAGMAVGVICAGTVSVVTGGLLGAAAGATAERVVELRHERA